MVSSSSIRRMTWLLLCRPYHDFDDNSEKGGQVMKKEHDYYYRSGGSGSGGDWLAVDRDAI